MSDWKRTTQEVSLEDIPTEMMTAIQRHIEQYNLGPILSESLMCVQTDSEKIKKEIFGKARTVKMTAIVTPRWLLWSIDQLIKNTSVLSAQLIHVTVQDYAQTPFARRIPDSGVEVSGMFTDAGEAASALIGLDEGVASRSFDRS